MKQFTVPMVGQLDFEMHEGLSRHTPKISKGNNSKFFGANIGAHKSIQHLSRTDLFQGSNGSFGNSTASLFVQGAHESFADHIPFEIRPEVVWYMVTHEIATLVKSDPGKYAKLFNGNPENPPLIEIIDNSLVYNGRSDWGQTISQFRAPLEKHIGPKMLNVLLPSFSTSDDESEVATLISFMDIVSKYFKYQVTTRCHIPEFRIEGLAEDWKKLGHHIWDLKSIFPELLGYFAELLLIIEEIYRTINGEKMDPLFWRSMYKYNNGSGGPFVTGWVNTFFAHVTTKSGPVLKTTFNWKEGLEKAYKGAKASDFSNHVSQVPFIWDFYGDKKPMHFIGGILGIDNASGFLSPRLGFGVVEREKNT